MDKKKIIVFWNNDPLGKHLNDDQSFIVCRSQSDYKSLKQTILKEARGFLVLCELEWDDCRNNLNSYEFGGIRIVQRIIRKKMGIKVPVVFASYAPIKIIYNPEDKDSNPENKIIKTPALNHFFVKVPQTPEKLKKLFDGTRNMTDTELAYTQLLYCDKRGLLVQINHVLTGRSIKDQDKYRKEIEYIMKELFPNDVDLNERFNNTNDLSVFCEFLLRRIDTIENTSLQKGFLYEKKHQTIRILLLEDELEEDKNVNRFVKYIQNMEQKAKEANEKPLFSITVEKNTNDIAYDSRHDPLSSERTHSLVEFDVFISDIEIRDDKGDLITLGFNVVETMAKESKRPLYYIVTNVSRSFYDQIKIPYIRRIRLKEEVFGSIEKIETFLYGIKEVFDNRVFEMQEKEPKSTKVFNFLFDYIKRDDIYPRQFNKPLTEEEKDIQSYDDIEKDIINKKTEVLIDFFKSLFKSNVFIGPKGSSRNFSVFDTNCETMRNHIKATIGVGNENLDKNICKCINNNQNPSDEDVCNFVVRMILRRFFLYVKWFIEQNSLMQSFEEYKNKIHRSDESSKNIKYTINDIACRAISEQYKTSNKQTHCIGKTLLISVRKPSHLTAEEEKFVEALYSGKY